MKNENFEIKQEKIPEGVKFNLRGRIDSTSVTEFGYKLENAVKDGAINITLNMLLVEYLSSAGIRVILKAYKDIRAAGGQFGIEMPSENVKNVLGMVALNEMLIK